jgi:hypothetical protein
MPKMKTVGQKNLKLLGGQAFFSQGPCDFDLKINRGHLLIMTSMPNVKTVGQRNLNFLGGKGKTDRRLDRCPTEME